MSLFKRFFVFMAMVIFAVSTAAVSVIAQDNRREMTVEESYLQDAIENMIIRESARSDTREQKIIALGYIEDAIARGNTSTDVQETLVYLTREGRRSVAREDGRVVNNFPDVRRRAAVYLGQIGTEEAVSALIDICRYENEPMVLQEAIKSLGDIGINENNQTINNIIWVVQRFDTLNPDNLMAIATIDAFEKIARHNNGLNSAEAVQLLIRITEGNYIRPVKERARQLLAMLRSFNS